MIKKTRQEWALHLLRLCLDGSTRWIEELIGEDLLVGSSRASQETQHKADGFVIRARSKEQAARAEIRLHRERWWIPMALISATSYTCFSQCLGPEATETFSFTGNAVGQKSWTKETTTVETRSSGYIKNGTKQVKGMLKSLSLPSGAERSWRRNGWQKRVKSPSCAWQLLVAICSFQPSSERPVALERSSPDRKRVELQCFGCTQAALRTFEEPAFKTEASRPMRRSCLSSYSLQS